MTTQKAIDILTTNIGFLSVIKGRGYWRVQTEKVYRLPVPFYGKTFEEALIRVLKFKYGKDLSYRALSISNQSVIEATLDDIQELEFNELFEKQDTNNAALHTNH